MTTTKTLRDALTDERTWLEDQRKSISKGNGSSWDMMQCSERINLIAAALAAADADQAPELDHGDTVLRVQKALGMTDTGWLSPDAVLLHLDLAIKSAARPAPADQAPDAAPWPDFLGQAIHHGDRLLHPQDGAEFVAVRLNGHSDAGDAWRAVYDNGTVSRLCLQIGDKGQAVLSSAARPAPVGAVIDETYMLKREIHNLKRHIEEYCPDSLPAEAAPVGAVQAPADIKAACYRVDWTSNEPAGAMLLAAMKEEIAELRATLGKAAAPAAPIGTTLAQWNSMLWAKNGPVPAEHAKPEPVEQAKLAEGSERAQFERHIRSECDSEEYAALILQKSALGTYQTTRIQGAWEGWQARGQQAGGVDGGAAKRLLKAATAYANDYCQDEADPEAVEDMICDADQHKLAVELFAAIASANQKGE